MNFFESLMLLESVTLTVKDVEMPTATVGSLSQFTQILNTLMSRQFSGYGSVRGNNPGMPIDIDGYDVNSKKGTINFYTDKVADKDIPKIVKAIKYYSGEYNVRVGEPKKDVSNLFGGRVIRFAAEAGGKHVPPPEVNMANELADIIFHDLLNYPRSMNLNMVELSARDIMYKLGQINDFTLGKATQEPKQEKNVFSGGVTKERLERKIQEIENLCKWAMDNNYDEISFS